MSIVKPPDMQGAPGAAPGSAPRTDIAAPVSINDALFKLATELRPGKQFDRAAFDARVKKALADDGQISKGEFEELMGLDKTGGVTERFWFLFTNGEKITRKEDLLECMQVCKENLDITGETLAALARSNNIMPVSREQLAERVKRMDLTQADLNRNPYLKKALERAKAITGDTDKTGFDGIRQRAWELLAFDLYHRFTLSGAWRELGYDDIKKLDISDPWTAERFGRLFTRFVKESKLPTEDELDVLLSHQEKVKKFRAWVEANGGSRRVEEAGQSFDLSARRAEDGRLVIDYVLENYEDEGLGWVLQQLQITAYQKKAAPAGGQDVAAFELSLRAGLGLG